MFKCLEGSDLKGIEKFVVVLEGSCRGLVLGSYLERNFWGNN